jgi:NAD+ synthase
VKTNEAVVQYMENPDKLLEQSCPSVDSLVEFIKREKRGIIGLSGGVDSALVLELAVRAMGKDNVYGLMMPANSQNIDVNYARNHAEKLGIKYRVVDKLSEVIKACKFNIGFFDNPLDEGNLKARLRMAHLYAAARQYHGVVLGTGNKSELMIGYFTKYGDGGVDMLPIGQLYKTQVWKLAKEIGVPDEIVKRTPTAGLWPGQTDEGEIGVKYSDLDKILLGIELQFEVDEIVKYAKVSHKMVNNLFDKWIFSTHKRQMPPMPASKFEGDQK